MKLAIDIENTDIEQLIPKLIEYHKANVTPKLQRCEDYYKGKQDILKRVIEYDKPNNKIVVNYCSYITDTMVGFFMGKPVKYSSNNKEYLKKLKEIFDSNDEQEENIELARKQSIKGTGYELIYIDEDTNIKFDVLDTDEVIMVYDKSINPKPALAIRYYTYNNFVDNNKVVNIEAYTKDKIFYYTLKENKLKLIEEKDHYFKEVPVIEYYNNIYRMGDFEKVISLQNDINLTMSNVSNELEYFRDCYLKIWGLEATDEEDIKNMKFLRVLRFSKKDEEDAEFMTKNINDTVIQNQLTNEVTSLHKVSYVPDLTKELPSNLSGSAIKQKFFNTEQIVISKERKFMKALQTRIRLITNILNLKGNNFNPNDIEITFTRNLPINSAELADACLKYVGIASKKRILTYLAPYLDIPDVDEELEQIEKEQHSYDIDKDLDYLQEGLKDE